MRTEPTQAYETVVQQLMACGLSRSEAVRMLDRHAHGQLAENARALQRYGVEYALACGALHAVRGAGDYTAETGDAARHSSAITWLLLAVLLAGIAGSLAKSTVAQVLEHAPSTGLLLRGLIAASAGCLFAAALKWLRP